MSQQGLITTDKIYVEKRESFKKAKVRAQWHLQTMLISALHRLWLRGGVNFFSSQHAYQAFGACQLVFYGD